MTDTTTTRGGWVCAVLLVLVLAIYAQTYAFSFLEYDDTVYVSRNPSISSGITWAGLSDVLRNGHNLLWIPVTSFTYMAGCALYGLSAAGHHLTNVVFHAAACLALFLVLARLTSRALPSAAVAMIFAVHPLNVEAVAWVSGRKELVYALFWFLTVGAYCHYVRRPAAGIYAVFVAFYLLGLASKSTQMMLPFVLFAVDYWPLRRPFRRDTIVRLIVEKVPLIVLAIPVALWAVIVHEQAGGSFSADRVSLLTRLWNAPAFYGFYLYKALVPSNLAAHYAYPVHGVPVAVFGFSLAVLIVLSAAAWFTRRQHPWFLTGWCWFILGLFPVCGIARAAGFLMADRYGYVPLVGLFMALAFELDALQTGKPAWRPRVVLATGAFIACMAVGAWFQTYFWRNDITLFKRAVTVEPGNPLVYNNLGVGLRRAGRLDDAIAVFEKGLQLQTPFTRDLHMNLGTALATEGRLDEAATHFGAVVHLKPDDAAAHFYLGKVRADQGRIQEAIDEYTRVLALSPRHVEAAQALKRLQERTQKGAPPTQ